MPEPLAPNGPREPTDPTNPEPNAGSRLRQQLGGLLLAVGAVQFVVAMAVTQLGWTTPYSILNDQISDLGSVHCGVSYGTHFACSPWHLLFNASVATFGLAILAGSLLVRPAFSAGRSRTYGLGMLGLSGIGAVGVGLFPWDANGGAHYLSALVAFLFGNLALLVLAGALTRGSLLGRHRGFTKASGLFGLGALIVYLALFFGAQYGSAPGTGGIERFVVAPLLLWLVVLGHRLNRTEGPQPDARGDPGRHARHDDAARDLGGARGPRGPALDLDPRGVLAGEDPDPVEGAGSPQRV